MGDVRWLLRVEDEGAVAAVGRAEGLHRPLLYVRAKGRSRLLDELLTILSAFSLRPSSRDYRESEVVRTLLVLSLSSIGHSSFLLAARRRADVEESTKPQDIGAAHRKLKEPILLIDEPDRADLRVTAGGGVGPALSALLTASLLSGLHRYGGALRQVCAQVLALRAFETGDKIFMRALALLAFDTHRFFARDLKLVSEPFQAELRPLVAPPDVVEQLCLDDLARGLEGLESDELAELFVRASGVVKGVAGLGREYLLGRPAWLAQRLRDLLRGGTFRSLVTVATEQWGLGLFALLHEILGFERAYVLYTQSSLMNRLLEEHLRESDPGAGGLEGVDVTYVPLAATDSLAVEGAVDHVIRKAGEGRETVVLGQGPAAVALKLCSRAARAGHTALLL